MLNAMHKKWSKDPSEDGHHKSSEGAIEIICSYPNWFEAKSYTEDKPSISCNIYSYLFGPSRTHEFASMDEALDEVGRWYKGYMGKDYKIEKLK